MLDPVVGALMAAGIALLLATAAWHKWRTLADFESILGAYQLLPHSVVPFLARLLPIAEVCTAAALLIPGLRALAALAAAALFVAYALGIAINLRRGRRDLDCGCTGANDRRPIAFWMVVRNVVLAVAVGAAAAPYADRPLGLVDALTVGGGLAILALLYLAIDRLLGQVMPRGAALRGSP